MGARQIEHLKSQGTDIARRSSVSKPDGASPIHPGMKSRSASNVTVPSRQCKTFAVPKITHGMTSDSERGHYDPSLASAIFGEAARASDDYARDLHAVPPPNVKGD